jgi:hypothetical protein
MRRYALAVLLLCGAIGASNLLAEDVQKEEEKILLPLDQVAALAAQRREGPGQPIVKLQIAQLRQPLTRNLLAPLKHLKHLRALAISCREIDADALACLGDVTGLQSLELSIFEVTDTTLSGLKDLTRLRKLRFWGPEVSDDGLANLEKLTRLESLRLNVPKVSNAGLGHLANLVELRELVLELIEPGGTPRASDRALIHFRRMAKLRLLSLSGMNVEGDGLAHLKDMDELAEVSFRHARIDNAAIKQLPPASRLRWLIGIGDTSRGLREYPGGKLKLEVHGAAVRLCDAGTGEAVTPLLKHRQTDRPGGWKITCWAFSPDGKLLVTGVGYHGRSEGRGQRGESLGEVRVWDVATGKLLAERTTGFVHAVAFLADSKTLIFAAEAHEVDGA